MILTTIFANCVALAVYTPYPEGDSNELNTILVSNSTNQQSRSLRRLADLSTVDISSVRLSSARAQRFTGDRASLVCRQNLILLPWAAMRTRTWFPDRMRTEVGTGAPRMGRWMDGWMDGRFGNKVFAIVNHGRSEIRSRNSLSGLRRFWGALTHLHAARSCAWHAAQARSAATRTNDVFTVVNLY